MNYKTKLSFFITEIRIFLKKKMIFFQVYFAIGILFLFSGFLLGNLFGSFLHVFHINSNSFITIILVLFQELISYLAYHSKKRKSHFIHLSFLQNSNLLLKKYNFFYFFLSYAFPNQAEKQWYSKKFFLLKSLNLFKIGILLGFFIDAFKVGS